MERYLKVGGSFIRRQYAPHLLLVLFFCCMSAFFVSFRNLDARQAAKVMEMYVAFVGILLLTPLFMPEQNGEIWLLKKSKAMPLWQLYLIRLLLAVTLLAMVVTIFAQLMRGNGSVFSFGQLWLGSFTEILFLGSIGFFMSAATNQVVLGYMGSVLYFMANIGASKYLGHLGLFQMMKGEYNFIPVMFTAAMVFLAGGIFVRDVFNKSGIY
ncbi:hypothetical protein D3Z36_16165 [Lachnospiraceae bacterium]|nr:hypothetical protein [Lachnospiraceae bacterium]